MPNLDLNQEPKIFSHAIQGNLFAIIDYLGQDGDPNLRAKNSSTIAMFLAQNGHLKALQLLTNFGADLTLKGEDNRTCLHWAARYGRFDVFKWLLAKQHTKQPKSSIYSLTNNINQKDDYGRTALCLAAREGHVNIVEYLLANKKVLNLDLHAVDKEYNNSLIIAAQNGNLPVVRCLLKNDDILNTINATNKKWHTALMTAIYCKEYAVAKYLINNYSAFIEPEIAGAKINLLVANSGRLDLLQALHANGFDIHQKTNLGYAPIFAATYHGYIDIFKWLVQEQGVDPNECYDGENCIYRASKYGKVNIVLWLLNSQYINETMDDFNKYIDRIIIAATNKVKFNPDTILWLLDHGYLSFNKLGFLNNKYNIDMDMDIIFKGAIVKKNFRLVNILIEDSKVIKGYINIKADYYYLALALALAIDNPSKDIIRLIIEYYITNKLVLPADILEFNQAREIAKDMRQQIDNLDLAIITNFSINQVYTTDNLKYLAILNACPLLSDNTCSTILSFADADYRIKQTSKLWIFPPNLRAQENKWNLKKEVPGIDIIPKRPKPETSICTIM